MGARDLDERVRLHLERELGFSLDSFPRAGVEVRESPKRSDEEENRLSIIRIGEGALATGIPRVVAAISPVIRSLTVEELFSPLGLAELRRAMAPEDAESLAMSERRPPAEAQQEDFVWAFACRHDDEDAEAAELALFGPRCASIAILIWRTEGLAGYGVWTEEAYRGRGYALAVVSAAAQFILEHDAAAMYGAYTTNIPSLRIPRRLGFTYAWQTIWA